MRLIPLEQYKKIIQILPVLCVDVIITNPRGEYLLIKRRNEPCKGQWWVVGGRVLKGETLKEGVVRKVRQETGLIVKKAWSIGYFEHRSKVNFFGLKMPYHAVSVVFAVGVDNDVKIRLDEQSEEWKFAKRLPVDFRVKKFMVS